MKIIRRAAPLAAMLTLLAAAAARAHVSLHPNTVPAGAFATIDVRVPGEQQGAYVTEVNMLFPPGFIGVDYEPVSGWSAKVIETKLARPVEEDGEKVGTQVSQIVWTWQGPQGKIENGQFRDFPLSLAVPGDAAGKALEFRTVESYSDGRKVHWIDPSLQAEHPSPRINVTAGGGVIEDVAGGEAGPAPGQTGKPGQKRHAGGGEGAAIITRPGGDSEGLAIAALVLGALGLLAGLAALAQRHRSRHERR